MNQDGADVVSGGGEATAGGVEYQSALAASVAVAMLSGGTISAWNLPAGTRIEFIWCEAPHAVDDLYVGLSNSGVVYIQAKRALSLDSQFRSAIDQFVRQFLHTTPPDTAKPWQRSFDRVYDRLVLATGRDGAASVLVDLRRVLERLRDSPAHLAMDELVLNKREMQAREKLTEATQSAWAEYTGRRAGSRELRDFFAALHIQRADVESGGAEEDVTRDRLGIGVVANRGDVELAWNTLRDDALTFARQRGGASADQLRRRLLDAGVRLFDRDGDVRISGARIHDICRAALPRQVERVGGDKYIREMFVARQAMRRLDPLIDAETAFRRDAASVLDHLRIASEHARLPGARAAVASFVREIETSPPPSRLEGNLRALKAEFRYDAIAGIAAQVHRTIREKDDDRFRDGGFRVLELLAGCDVAQHEPAQVIAQRLVAAREDIVRNTRPALNGIWHLLPCIPSASTAEPAVLASTLLDDLTAIIDAISRRCAAIIGAAGHGKTNALCAMAERIIHQDPVILLSGVTRFADELTIERTITHTLSQTPLSLNAVGAALARSGHRMWVIIDTLDQTPDHVTAAHAIARFLADIGQLRINLVIGCRDTFWPFFESAVTAHLSAGSPVLLSAFEGVEWEQALKLYLERYAIRCHLEAAAEHKLRNPLLLHFFCLANRDKDLGTINDLRPLEVFDQYIARSVQDIARRREKLDATSGTRLMENVAAKMWELTTTTLALEDSGIPEEQLESALSMYSDLKAASILREESWDENDQLRYVRFTYDELCEYMLARSWNGSLEKGRRGRGGTTVEQIVEAALERLDFPPTMGALVFLQRMHGTEVLRLTIARIVARGEQYVVKSQGAILLALRNLRIEDAPEEIKTLLYMLQSHASPAVRDEIAPIVIALLEQQPSDVDFRRMSGRILGVDLDIALTSSQTPKKIPRVRKRQGPLRFQPGKGFVEQAEAIVDEPLEVLPPAQHRYSRTARLNALAAIARHGRDEDVTMLIDAMARIGQAQIYQALEAFRSIDRAGDSIVFTLVERFAASPLPEYRVYSCWLLRNRYGSTAARLMLRLLLDRETRVHRYAYRRFRERRVEPELFAAIVTRFAAAEPLEPWHARNLLDLMRQGDDGGRSSEISRILTLCAGSENLSVRIRALGYLAKIDGMQARSIADQEPDDEIRPLLVRAASSDSDMRV